MNLKENLSELRATTKLQWKLASMIPGTQRQTLLRQLREISKNVSCPHNESEILTVGLEVLSIPKDREGYVVEAGLYKGGSTAKISLFCKLSGRKLVAFDSFEGIPENTEEHAKSTLGHSLEGWFAKGTLCGSLDEVKANIEKYGEMEVCTFIKGWFENTMPDFKEKIAVAYLDVDLAASTRTCLKYLYPLIVSGGVLYSQDGDIPLAAAVFRDERFWEEWEEEVGFKMPHIENLGKKLIKVTKNV